MPKQKRHKGAAKRITYLTNTHQINLCEIRYFHPTGRTTLPNGHPIQKGGFLHECRINSDSFEPSLCSGYCIILPSNQSLKHDDINACTVATDISVTYTIGNHFKGQYADAAGEIFNDNSISIIIEDLSSRKLTTIVEQLSKTLSVESLLIKDFSNNKIFIVRRKS